jgi:hypothetical protein
LCAPSGASCPVAGSPPATWETSWGTPSVRATRERFRRARGPTRGPSPPARRPTSAVGGPPVVSVPMTRLSLPLSSVDGVDAGRLLIEDGVVTVDVPAWLAEPLRAHWAPSGRSTDGASWRAGSGWTSGASTRGPRPRTGARGHRGMGRRLQQPPAAQLGPRQGHRPAEARAAALTTRNLAA